MRKNQQQSMKNQQQQLFGNQLQQNQLSNANQQLSQNYQMQQPQYQQMPQYQQQQQQSIFQQSYIPQQQYQFAQNSYYPLQGNLVYSQLPDPEQLRKMQEIQQQYQQDEMNYSHQRSTFKFVPQQKFDDDDEIISKTKTKTETTNSTQQSLSESLEFTCKSLFSQGKLLKSQVQRLPGTVSLKMQENQDSSAGLDLICVIDISGSMIGQKILNVKKTLIALLDFLSEKDRLCLILYDNQGLRLTPLKVVSEKNKDYFKNAILFIKANGGNVMPNGTKLAYQQIQERKYHNDVTAIFLLSDGIEDHQCANDVQKQHSKCKQTLSLYTFGFGADHDAVLMSRVCKIGNGSFYFVNDVSLLDEFFADAIGGLVSAIGKNLQIDIKCYPKQPFQNISIGKCYGDMWITEEVGRHYQIKQSYLAAGLKKDYVFELVLPQYADQIQDDQRQVVVIEVKATFFATESKQQVSKTTHLMLKLFNENEDVPNQDQDWDVYTEYTRVKATDCIDAARQACENQQFNQAQEMLNNFQQQIESNPIQQKNAKNTLQDILQAKQACEQKNYHNYGQKQMIQMHSNNYQQQGMTAQFNMMGMQTSEGQGQYSNQTQQIFVQKMKIQKQQQH